MPPKKTKSIINPDIRVPAVAPVLSLIVGALMIGAVMWGGGMDMYGPQKYVHERAALASIEQPEITDAQGYDSRSGAFADHVIRGQYVILRGSFLEDESRVFMDGSWLYVKESSRSELAAYVPEDAVSMGETVNFQVQNESGVSNTIEMVVLD